MRRRRNNKSTYFIIALVCLILLNIGSMIIQFNRNYISPNISREEISLDNFFSREKIMGMIRSVFKMDDQYQGDNGNRDDYDGRDNMEHYNENLEDFIIIDTLEEYENLIIVKDSSGKGSIENIPDPINIKRIEVDDSKPYIFIYHTHTTEAYEGFDRDSYYTTNEEKNVIKIGRTLSKVLEAGQHKVIHETKVHDRPSFNQSYSRSLNTINQAKEENENLKFFFDIHRDGVDEDAPYYDKFVNESKIKIGDVDTATFSLVVGANTPNYDQVLSYAKYIKAVSDTLYPGLCKGIIVKPYTKFNLYISDYASLVEIGSNVNTIEEANECAKLVGEILTFAINGIKE